MVHLHIIAGLLQVQFDIVSRSDTESGVRFILSSMVQKIAYRRIGLLSLCAASPMGEGLMDIPQLISILWQSNGTVFILIRHYVHAVKRQGSWLTPAQLLSLRGASGYVFKEVSGLLQSLDSNPGPSDPKLPPLPVLPPRLHGLSS